MYLKVFFCNSGAEAVEGAIKVARKYFYSKGETSRNEFAIAKRFRNGSLAEGGQVRTRPKKKKN